MSAIPFHEIEKAGRSTHKRESVTLLNELTETTLLSFDLFSWDGLLIIAKLTPALLPLRKRMEELEKRGFSGQPFVSSSHNTK